MYVNLSSEFSEVIARAFAGGVETSIEQLAIVIGVDDLPRLLAARRVIDMVHRLKLELAPSEEVLEFNSLRVLRPAASAGTSSNRIGSLIAAGECASIEFKSSMLCSMRDWRDSSKLVEFPSLQGEILKTVCAFLNTEGGDLLVVHLHGDDLKDAGLEDDLGILGMDGIGQSL